MRAPTIAPTGQLRWLGADDLIVSKTDPRGIITYANVTFARMARYTEAELIGAPHSIVRHPDMPRCVFKLLWDTIARGDEVFAYVLNLASDGVGYWVLAHVTPTYDSSGTITGYHSNRRAPDRGAVEAVTGVYADLLAHEKGVSGAREAAAAGEALLGSVLQNAGVTYPEFFWSITP